MLGDSQPATTSPATDTQAGIGEPAEESSTDEQSRHHLDGDDVPGGVVDEPHPDGFGVLALGGAPGADHPQVAPGGQPGDGEADPAPDPVDQDRGTGREAERVERITAVVPATGSVAATVADRPAGMRAVFGADSTVVSA